MKIKLYAPREYWELSKEQKSRICNGCGAKGSFLAQILPQWHFKEACNIHDYMYLIGKTDDDKKVADRVFINNLHRVTQALPPMQKPLARAIARIYYEAVAKFGYEAFWKNKTYPGLVGKEVEV